VKRPARMSLAFCAVVAVILWATGLRVVPVRWMPGGIAVALAAPPQATVTLVGLPAGAHVYVDDKEVRLRRRVARLAPGIHEVQIEALDAREADRVVAMRLSVEVTAGQRTELEVRLYPVYALWESPTAHLGPGPAGPPGLPARGFASPPDLAAQTRLVRDGLSRVLGDLEREIDFVQTFPYRFPKFYWWFAPFDAEPTLPRPPPNDAPLGVRGAVGPSGDVLLIQDANGRPVVEAAKTHLGLTELEKRVNTGASRARALRSTPRNIHIHIYSPKLRDRLNRQFGRDERLPGLRLPGPPGAHGPPGEIRGVPPEARPPRLGPEEVAALMTRLEQDADLKARIDRLRRRLRELDALSSESELRNGDTQRR
jgi:hypothetical protein